MKTPPSPTADALRASIAARVARLTAALGEPFTEDPRLASYAQALAEAEAAKRPRSQPPREDFLARADAYLAAREIALAVVTKRLARDHWENVAHRALALWEVESIRLGHVRTLGQLEQLETAFFAEWGDPSSAKTRGFWSAVKKAGLPFAPRARG